MAHDGDPRTAGPRVLERFWKNVNKTSSHWWWTGSTVRGYGAFSWKGRMGYAHRFSYELENGPIPAGLEIDHVKKRGCGYPLCVLPAHLEAVTHRENVLRGTSPMAAQARQTHCIHGHEFSLENTWIRSNGERHCRRCRANNERRRRQNKRKEHHDQ